MKYVPTVFFGTLLLAAMSPWFTMVIDFYWWFFNDHSFSGIEWRNETGFLRTMGLFLTAPPIIIFGVLFATSFRDLEHKLRMEKE
jgi:hypothetical protein